jgi:hypothetical protein
MILFGLYLLTNRTVFFGNIPTARVLNPNAWFQNGALEGKVSLNGLIMFRNKSHTGEDARFPLQRT